MRLLVRFASDPAVTVSHLWSSASLQADNAHAAELFAAITARPRAVVVIPEVTSIKMLTAFQLKTTASRQRLSAAVRLIEMGDPRGLEALNGQASDPASDPELGAWRLTAATQLARRGYQAGIDILNAEISKEQGHFKHFRAAALGLAVIGDPRGADILAALVEQTPDYIEQILTADMLAETGDSRGIDILWRLARGFAHGKEYALNSGLSDSTLWFQAMYECEAAACLAKRHDRRAHQALVDIAETDALPASNRVMAASALAKNHDPRGAEFLAAIAAECLSEGRPDLKRIEDEVDVMNAARALTDNGDPRGPELTAIVTERRRQADQAEHDSDRRTRRGRRRYAAIRTAFRIASGLLAGDVISHAPGTHPGTGNWIALAISCCGIAITFAILGDWPRRILMKRLRMSARGWYNAEALQLPVFLLSAAAGYFTASQLPVLPRTAAATIWAFLLWR
jgi:HEAT repeat protein